MNGKYFESDYEEALIDLLFSKAGSTHTVVVYPVTTEKCYL